MTSFRLIHPPQEDGRIGLVFIHGIDGDHRETWTNINNDVCWIDWLNDISIPIYAFSHEASKTDLQNIFSLDEIALHLRTQFDQHPEIETWICICHSLGGLIAKRAYVELRKSHRATFHFVFFSTPHVGTRFRFISAFIRSLIHREHIVQTLTADETYLNSLNKEFLSAAVLSDSQILSFYETRRIFGLQIVSRSATIIGKPYEETIPLYGDHLQICKFASREDSGFRRIKTFIDGIVEKSRTFKIRPYERPKF